MRENWKNYLGNKAFYRKVAAIAIPISLQSLITIGVNMMDTVMLGRMGETQLSASSLANQFISIFQIMCMGMGMGASVLTSRYWGKKDIPALKRAVTIMYRLCLVIGSAFTIATILMPERIMAIYTPKQPMIDAGVLYFKWSVPCYLLLGFSLTTTIVLRSVGKVKIPLFCSIIAFFINVFANWVFIFGKLGAPRMEIAGAALGTLIARIFEFCFICGYFLFVNKEIGYRIKNIFMKCNGLVREYLVVSIPVLISDTLLALGNNEVARVMGEIGENFVAANAITVVVVQLSTVLIQGISNASCVITGNTLGEGKVKEAQAQGYTFWGLGLMIGLLAAGVVMAVSGPMIRFYKLQDATNEIARALMNAISFIIVFQAQNSILTKGVLRGGGDTRFLMVADILFLWVVSVPLGRLAGLVWMAPPFWVYVCLKSDQVIKAIWCIFRLRSGKWIKKINASV